ncbi:MAG: DUF2076 domain-containing protein [Actinobacteria bacterium]|nr:DUF2076 domain-containing protein [Actinomycetota bacterium]
MHPDEEQLIRDLAARVQQDQPVTKDADADTVIQQTIANQPDAVYILTQAVLVQEQALHAARDQINGLNQSLAAAQQRQAPAPLTSSTGGGFLSHLFGQASGVASAAAGPGPVGVQQAAPQSGLGGGFLRNAASMAVGVVAGDTIFSGLSDLF